MRIVERHLEVLNGWIRSLTRWDCNSPSILQADHVAGANKGDTHNRACQGIPAAISLNNTPLCFFFIMRALQTPIRTDAAVQDKLRGGPAQSP